MSLEGGPRFTIESFKSREEAEKHIADIFDRKVVVDGFSDNAVSTEIALQTLHAIWSCPLLDKANDFKDMPDAVLHIVFDPERRAESVSVTANEAAIVLEVPTNSPVDTATVTGAIQLQTLRGVSESDTMNNIRANYGLPPEDEKPAPGIRFEENE